MADFGILSYGHLYLLWDMLSNNHAKHEALQSRVGGGWVYKSMTALTPGSLDSQPSRTHMSTRLSCSGSIGRAKVSRTRARQATVGASTRAPRLPQSLLSRRVRQHHRLPRVGVQQQCRAGTSLVARSVTQDDSHRTQQVPGGQAEFFPLLRRFNRRRSLLSVILLW